VNAAAAPVAVRVALQILAYAAFVLVVGYLSAAPRYSPLAPGLALLRVSFSHAGERAAPCRRFTPEELAKLAPNMRRPMDCARERVALRVQVAVDGTVLLDEELPAAGLSRDGAATVYARFPVTPGRHELEARLRDTPRSEGFDHESTFTLDVRAGDNRVLEFRTLDGGFRLL
jgi:hypothetical protein